MQQNFSNPFGVDAAYPWIDAFRDDHSLWVACQERGTIRIFDLAGHEVVTLMDRVELPAGRHQRVWDGRDAQGRAMPNGVYFLSAAGGKFCKDNEADVGAIVE